MSDKQLNDSAGRFNDYLHTLNEVEQKLFTELKLDSIDAITSLNDRRIIDMSSGRVWEYRFENYYHTWKSNGLQHGFHVDHYSIEEAIKIMMEVCRQL